MAIPSNRNAAIKQNKDKSKKDFLRPIFFKRSTDTHTPKLFQYNCVAYVLQT